MDRVLLQLTLFNFYFSVNNIQLYMFNKNK